MAKNPKIDDPLTLFLVELCIDKDLPAKYVSDKKGTLAAFKVKQTTIDMIDVEDRDGLKELIGNQQGGTNGRQREANKLAEKAASLAGEAKTVAKSAKALAKSLGKKRKKR